MILYYTIYIILYYILYYINTGSLDASLFVNCYNAVFTVVQRVMRHALDQTVWSIEDACTARSVYIILVDILLTKNSLSLSKINVYYSEKIAIMVTNTLLY